MRKPHEDAHLGEAAPHEPRHHVGEPQEPPGHAQLVHQVAGQDEGGDSQEGEVLGLRQGQLHGHGELKPGLGEEEDQPSDSNGEDHGHPQKQEEEEHREAQQHGYPFRAWRSLPKAVRSMRRLPALALKVTQV